jgi:hypothetical protein
MVIKLDCCFSIQARGTTNITTSTSTPNLSNVYLVCSEFLKLLSNVTFLRSELNGLRIEASSRNINKMMKKVFTGKNQRLLRSQFILLFSFFHLNVFIKFVFSTTKLLPLIMFKSMFFQKKRNENNRNDTFPYFQIHPLYSDHFVIRMRLEMDRLSKADNYTM